MLSTEHWRLRLLELIKSYGMTQAAFAKHIGTEPSYLSRLLYVPGKAGRKNLGLTTLTTIRAACKLPADWFDMPLGSALPGADNLTPQAEPTALVKELHSSEPRRIHPAIVWPFHIVTYQRIAAIQEHFKGRHSPSAISDIDKHLDVLVQRWENEISKKKSGAA